MTYGPTDPINNPNHSRWEDFNNHREHADFRWGQGWLIGYLIALAVTIGMYLINHQFTWGGMIFNLIVFTLISMVQLPVLTVPTITGTTVVVDFLKRFIPGFNTRVFESYFSKVLPEVQFWVLLVVGSMAAFPWHLGAWWAIIPVAAGSWFAVVHWWKYKYDTKIVQNMSRMYVMLVIVVGVGFALGLNKPVERMYEWWNPPTIISTETGKPNQMYDPVAKKRFPHLSPEECAERSLGYCINPDTGTRLVPYIPDPNAPQAANGLGWTYAGQFLQGQSAPQTSTGALVLGNLNTAPQAEVVPAGKPTEVTVPGCNGASWAEIFIPAKWLMTPAWQAEIAKVQFLPNGATAWTESSANLRSGISAVRYCAQVPLYAGRKMGLTWERL